MGDIDLSRLQAAGTTPICDSSTTPGRVWKASIIGSADDTTSITKAWNLANIRWLTDSAFITYKVAPKNYYYGNGLRNARPVGTRPGGHTDGSTTDDLFNILEDLTAMDNNPSSNVNGYGRPGKVEGALAQICREYNCDAAQAKKTFRDLVMKYNVANNHIKKDWGSLEVGDVIFIPLTADAKIDVDRLANPDKKTPPQADGTIDTIEEFLIIGDRTGKVRRCGAQYTVKVRDLKYQGKPVKRIFTNAPNSEACIHPLVWIYLENGEDIELYGKDAVNYLSNTRLKIKTNGYEGIFTALEIASFERGKMNPR